MNGAPLIDNKVVHPWPVTPHPREDELFSSWAIRAAHANGQKLSTLLHFSAPNRKNIDRNLDNSIKETELGCFASFMRIPTSTALSTSLDSLEGLLFEKSTPKANRKLGVLNTGTSKTEYARFHLQFCPICLSEGEPYFRRLWRISHFTVCTNHGVKLLDRCPHCSSSLQPIRLKSRHRYSEMETNLAQCYQCGNDLSKAPAVKADSSVLQDTRWYLSTLRNGYAELYPGYWVYSFSLFSTLRHLMRCILEIKEIDDNTGQVIHDIDIQPAETRYQCLLELTGTFSDWPTNFLKMCARNNLKYYKLEELKKANGNVPFWFYSVIRENIYNPNIAPTDRAIGTAVEHLKSQNQRISGLRVNKILGLNDSARVKTFLKSNR